jgi:hypothetical protein
LKDKTILPEMQAEKSHAGFRGKKLQIFAKTEISG